MIARNEDQWIDAYSMKKRPATPMARPKPALRCAAAPVEAGGVGTVLLAGGGVAVALVLSEDGTVRGLDGWIAVELWTG